MPKPKRTYLEDYSYLSYKNKPTMRTILTVCWIFMYHLGVSGQSQELDRLLKSKQDLIDVRDKLSDSIKKIDVRINFLQNQKKSYENIEADFSITKTRSEAKIKNKPDILGDLIGTIPPEETIKVFDYFNGYFLIEKDSIKGYTSEMYLYKNSTMTNLIRKQDKNEVIKKYGETIANRIFAHEIWIGMTSDMAILSRGRPLEINRSVGNWGVDEQWVYSIRRYIYFRDGKLTSWQD